MQVITKSQYKKNYNQINDADQPESYSHQGLGT